MGYEADQVFRKNGEDISVPITWTYNHHYEAFLTNSDSKFVRISTNSSNNDWGIYNRGAKKFWEIDYNSSSKNGIPNSIFFWRRMVENLGYLSTDTLIIMLNYYIHLGILIFNQCK